MKNILNLSHDIFKDTEILLLENENFKVYSFKYTTGVEALKIQNSKGYFIILPYQGQQIWYAEFLDQPLNMKTTFKEPVPTDIYLETYGGFLLHCGVKSMGAPEEGYPQHGELPNAIYQKAFLIVGEDEKGMYISVSGEREYNRGFIQRYVFTPECRLYQDETVLKVKVNLKNLRGYDMPYMYLCHINFRPIEGSKLIYSAKCDKEHIKVCKPKYSKNPTDLEKQWYDYMDAIQENPGIHNTVDKTTQCYDPEICFTVDYLSDDNGFAHTMQKFPDGRAFYVSHPLEFLPVGVRWISRTCEEDSMGMILPATAEHFGRSHAEKTGQLKILSPYSEVSFEFLAGLLEKEYADKIEQKVYNILNKNI